MPVVHEVKCWPNYFDAIESGEKPFDVRRDDRGYQKGDTLFLRRYDPAKLIESDKYTGSEMNKEITYVLTGGQFGIEPGYVVLGLAR